MPKLLVLGYASRLVDPKLENRIEFPITKTGIPIFNFQSFHQLSLVSHYPIFPSVFCVNNLRPLCSLYWIDKVKYWSGTPTFRSFKNIYHGVSWILLCPCCTSNVSFDYHTKSEECVLQNVCFAFGMITEGNIWSETWVQQNSQNAVVNIFKWPKRRGPSLHLYLHK